MACPPQYREPPPSLPSIMSSGAGRQSHKDASPFSRSPAIAIHKFDFKDDAPPPLPPPRHLPFLEAPARREDSHAELQEYGRSISSLASGYGSMASSFADDRPGFKSTGTGSSLNGDEGYSSYTATDRCVAASISRHSRIPINNEDTRSKANPLVRSRDARPTEFLHHNKFVFQTAADLHGDSMKKKLDPIRTFDKSSDLQGCSTFSEQARQPDPRALGVNPPVKLPIHSRSTLDSPSRVSEPSITSTASPRFSPRPAPFRSLTVDQRLAKDASDFEHSPRSRTHRNSDDSSSLHGSYEYHTTEEMDVDETTSPRRHHREPAYATAGHKRRAASPPAIDHSIHSSSGDVRRRDMSSRCSPTPRLAVGPQNSPSVSGFSSAALSRSNSYISMSIPASSAATATSFCRMSPGAASPERISPTSGNSPYTTPSSQNHSPRTSISGRGNAHGRAIAGQRKIADVQKPTGTKIQRVFMCECCPKKPKKFETAEELG